MSDAIALTPLEKAFVATFTVVILSVIGWLVLRLDSIDDKREEDHRAVVVLLRDSTVSMQSSLQQLEVKQAQFSGEINAKLVQLEKTQK